MTAAQQKTALIIGAGPAGLTAAWELLTRTDIVPVILEKSDFLGGLARTAQFKGNRIDIGGHRFFSKSDRVVRWWLDVLPLQEGGEDRIRVSRRRQSPAHPPTADGVPDAADRVMLIRRRKSRIYFLRRFFDYPISLSMGTFRNLGLVRTFRIGCSCLWAMAFPALKAVNLEQFLVNRFGRELYRTFFKSYTEKVWGVPCDRISAEWGEQRIRGLSIRKALAHFLKKTFLPTRTDVTQQGTETSLIEQFMYPKFGPGQMWEEVARRVEERGGRVLRGMEVAGVHVRDNRVLGVTATDAQSGGLRRFDADYVFSSMAIKDLFRAFDSDPPARSREAAEGLIYRDFITVGMLVDRLRVGEKTDRGRKLIEDNWIYIQEPDVLLARLQVFNNWSPSLVADPQKVWLGLEYFCCESDELWKKSDEQMIRLAKEELVRIGMVAEEDFLEAVVIRVPRTYPAYIGAYENFADVRSYVDRIGNLFLIGRNGMHRYNNMDHSMLTAMTAVDNILADRTDKANIWDVNTEQVHHEGAK